MAAMNARVGALLDLDQGAGNLFGRGWFIVLGWTGADWRWGQSFQSSSIGSAMGTMRLSQVRGERVYLFRWVPNERRWGRVA